MPKPKDRFHRFHLVVESYAADADRGESMTNRRVLTGDAAVIGCRRRVMVEDRPQCSSPRLRPWPCSDGLVRRGLFAFRKEAA